MQTTVQRRCSFLSGFFLPLFIVLQELNAGGTEMVDPTTFATGADWKTPRLPESNKKMIDRAPVLFRQPTLEFLMMKVY